MEREALADELAYVRSLAEEGRNAPLTGGVLYVTWGGVIGVAALVQYAAMLGVIGLSGAGTTALWVGALALGWALSRVLGPRAGRKAGGQTIGNRTASSAWFAIGLFITGLWFVLLFAHDNYVAIGVPPYFLFKLMFPIAFGLYGIAFFTTAVAARLSFLRNFAYAAWAFSFVLVFLMDSSLQMLVAAAGSVTCAVFPGIILMRREPSDIV